MSEILPAVEIGPKGAPAGTVLWLHGLGASGHDFEDIVPLLGLPRVRFVFPHAPARPVTVNGGFVMPAWYDILSLGGRETREDARGIRESARLIEALLAREDERGVPSSRVVLAGFSQGGALALYVGTRYPRPLLGIMVLSAYEPLAETGAREAHAANRETPMLFCHGTADPVVPVFLGRSAKEAEESAGHRVEWKEYPMGHEVCLDEIRAIQGWLTARFDEAGRTEPRGGAVQKP